MTRLRNRPRVRLEALEARLAPSGSPALVKDIAPGSADSTPTAFAAMNGLVYFAAAGPTGDELWKTAGTPPAPPPSPTSTPAARSSARTAARPAT
jgi:hypothetical protein